MGAVELSISTVNMRTFFVVLAIAVVAISASPKKGGKGGKGGKGSGDPPPFPEGTCEIPQEDMDYMMSVGQGCLYQCYGDLMGTGYGSGDYGNYGSGDYGYSGYSGDYGYSGYSGNYATGSGFYGPTGSGYYTTAYPT